MFASALTMLFLVIALISALLGFGEMAGTSTETAQMLFVVFGMLAVISYFRGRRHQLH